MIIPMGVTLYAVTGGLKATFTTSYIHTIIIFAVCCLFMFKTYAGGGVLGSIDLVGSCPIFLVPVSLSHQASCFRVTAAIPILQSQQTVLL